jgi:2-polyprenyl-3-methyl-5-hydroxy-6-metoxy-1,4-benzoquinol methylase
MNCRLCSSDSLNLFYVQGYNDQFNYYKCKNCGLVNLDLDNLNIIENQQQFADRFNPAMNHEIDKGGYAAFQFFTKYVPVKGTYMDIGCGSCSVLYFAKKNGWIVKGLELSPVFAGYAKTTLNIDVELADFLKYKESGVQYDLVSLRHVLEHLPDSILAMNKISGLLKKNGYAHFEFPNINSLSHRLQRVRNKISFLKKKYDPSFVTGHCNQFSKQTFEFLLGKTGFKLIRWETYSFKPFNNFIFNHIHIGTKARAIVQKSV